MKNFIKKLITISISVTFLCTFPAYASETKPVLTLDAAIKAAYTYNNQLSLNSKENQVLAESLKYPQDDSYYTSYTNYLKKAKNEQQLTFIKDQIAYDITVRYNNLVLLEKLIAKQDINIAVKTNELSSLALKKDMGLISSINYQNSQVELDNLKTSKSSNSESLNNDRNYFKRLTGKNLSSYTLDHTLNIESFRIPGSIDGYISNKIDIYLKYDKELAEFSADNIIKDGDPAMPYANYLDKKYQSEKTLTDIESTRQTLQNSLANSYTSLLNIEDQIAATQTQLALAKTNLEMSQLQHKMGMISTKDYYSKTLSVQDIEYNLMSLISKYNSLKVAIQKPWATAGK